MFDRIWWFATGIAAGIWVTVRALKRSPTPVEWARAAVGGGAGLLDLAARAVRPNRGGAAFGSR